MLGLGWPQWLLIIGLVAGLLLTFRIMAKASVAYERARIRREQAAAATTAPEDPSSSEQVRSTR